MQFDNNTFLNCKLLPPSIFVGRMMSKNNFSGYVGRSLSEPPPWTLGFRQPIPSVTGTLRWNSVIGGAWFKSKGHNMPSCKTNATWHKGNSNPRHY